MAGPREPLPIPIISFDTNYSNQIFYQKSELLVWAKIELNSFSWIPTVNDHKLTDLINIYSDFHQLLSKFLNVKADTINQGSGFFDTIEPAIRSFYNSGKGISSTSPLGKFIIDQKKLHGDVSAVWSLNSLIEKPVDAIPETFDGLQGIVRAVTFEDNSSIDAASLQNLLLKSIEQSNQLFKSMKSEFELTLNENALALGELTSKTERTNAESAAVQSQRSIDFDIFLSESRSQVQEAKNLFSVALALEAPVTYWTAKAKRHLTMMGFSGASTFVIAGGLLTFIYMKSPDVTGSFADINIGSVIFLLSVSTFLIWLIRLSAKIFIANLHLRDDAEERVTMMQAFLALSKDTESMSASDSSVIFNALFRPASSGLIKDDGVNSPIEVILNSFKSR